MRRLLMLLSVAALGVAGLACKEHPTRHHCANALAQLRSIAGHTGDYLYTDYRTGDWDNCDVYSGDGRHRHYVTVNIHTEEVVSWGHWGNQP